MGIGQDVTARQAPRLEQRPERHSSPTACTHFGARRFRPDRKSNKPPDVLMIPTGAGDRDCAWRTAARPEPPFPAKECRVHRVDDVDDRGFFVLAEIAVAIADDRKLGIERARVTHGLLDGRTRATEHIERVPRSCACRATSWNRSVVATRSGSGYLQSSREANTIGMPSA